MTSKIVTLKNFLKNKIYYPKTLDSAVYNEVLGKSVREQFSDVNQHLPRLLWTNSDSTKAMEEGFEINLADDNYDLLLILWRINNTSLTHENIIIEKGTNTQLSYTATTGGSYFSLVTRQLIYANDTKYTVAVGLSQNSNSTRTNDNNKCIPTKIYGIKLN